MPVLLKLASQCCNFVGVPNYEKTEHEKLEDETKEHEHVCVSVFSQQPPLHLSAPSPIHPSQLAPLAGQALNTNTLTVSTTLTTLNTNTLTLSTTLNTNMQGIIAVMSLL